MPPPDHPHPNLLPSREKGPERPLHPSAPCALRCRARWIPAFAGMTGPRRGGAARELRDAPPPRVRSRCRARWIPAFRWNDGAYAGTTGSCAYAPPDHPHPRLLPSREKGPDGGNRFGDGYLDAVLAFRCAHIVGGAGVPVADVELPAHLVLRDLVGSCAERDGDAQGHAARPGGPQGFHVIEHVTFSVASPGEGCVISMEPGSA